MSVFQFPANPADGDIVVRGNLLATYNIDTNTWEVGEIPTYPGVPGPVGPQGPQGVKGDVGSGIEVNGVVPTYSDLPVDPPTGSFFVVQNTNTLHYWDGKSWYDLGSPIQGPQGIPGPKGEAGDDGINGFDGKGWFDTDIDETDGEYKIIFKSNDGLSFITDDLKGGSWTPVYATATTPGLVKLGRGLDLTDEGELEQRDTYVQIETVPLGGKNNDQPSFALDYTPGYLNWTDQGTPSTSGYTSGPTYTQSGSMQVPPNSNGALFYFFTGSTCSHTGAPGGGYGLQWTVYAQLVASVTVGGAVFENGANNIAIPMTHNFSIGSESRRASEQPTTKIGQLIYPTGTTSLNFTLRVSLNAFQRARIAYGRGRIIVVPYLDDEGQAQIDSGEGNQRTLAQAYSVFNKRLRQTQEDVSGSEPYIPQDPPTEAEIKQENAQQLRTAMQYTLGSIDSAVVQNYPSGEVYDLLMATRLELEGLVDLPGTYDQIWDEYDRLSAIVEPYIGFTFRFE